MPRKEVDFSSRNLFFVSSSRELAEPMEELDFSVEFDFNDLDFNEFDSKDTFAGSLDAVIGFDDADDFIELDFKELDFKDDFDTSFETDLVRSFDKLRAAALPPKNELASESKLARLISLFFVFLIAADAEALLARFLPTSSFPPVTALALAEAGDGCFEDAEESNAGFCVEEDEANGWIDESANPLPFPFGLSSELTDGLLSEEPFPLDLGLLSGDDADPFPLDFELESADPLPLPIDLRLESGDDPLPLPTDFGLLSGDDPFPFDFVKKY